MTVINSSWGFPPVDLALSSNDIHVWCASLDQPATCFQLLAQTLSPDEWMRARGFYFEEDRKRFIVGRGLLRAILGRLLRVEPSRLQFCYGSYGKPTLVEMFGGRTLYFNLSHSQGLALYAVTRYREIGVDLECVRPISEFEQIAESFFSVRERAELRTCPPGKKHQAFFNCWTRKEAYLKAIGDGLTPPLDSFEVSLTPGEPARLLSIRGDLQEASSWSLQELVPAASYIAALAVKGHDWHLACWQWREEKFYEE